METHFLTTKPYKLIQMLLLWFCNIIIQLITSKMLHGSFHTVANHYCYYYQSSSHPLIEMLLQYGASRLSYTELQKTLTTPSTML